MKLTLEFDDKAESALEDLKRRIEIDDNCFLFACMLAFYELVLSLQEEGAKIVITHKDGEQENLPSVLPELPVKKQMNIYYMNPSDYWMANSLAEAVADAMKQYKDGNYFEEDMVSDAHQLADSELDRLIYHDYEEGTKRTFREELRLRVDSGITKPELFATTDI